MKVRNKELCVPGSNRESTLIDLKREERNLKLKLGRLKEKIRTLEREKKSLADYDQSDNSPWWCGKMDYKNKEKCIPHLFATTKFKPFRIRVRKKNMAKKDIDAYYAGYKYEQLYGESRDKDKEDSESGEESEDESDEESSID